MVPFVQQKLCRIDCNWCILQPQFVIIKFPEEHGHKVKLLLLQESAFTFYFNGMNWSKWLHHALCDVYCCPMWLEKPEEEVWCRSQVCWRIVIVNAWIKCTRTRFFLDQEKGKMNCYCTLLWWYGSPPRTWINTGFWRWIGCRVCVRVGLG